MTWRVDHVGEDRIAFQVNLIALPKMDDLRICLSEIVWYTKLHAGRSPRFPYLLLIGTCYLNVPSPAAPWLFGRDPARRTPVFQGG